MYSGNPYQNNQAVLNLYGDPTRTVLAPNANSYYYSSYPYGYNYNSYYNPYPNTYYNYYSPSYGYDDGYGSYVYSPSNQAFPDKARADALYWRSVQRMVRNEY